MELELKHIQHYPIGGYNALNITDGCEVKLVDGIYTFDNKKEFWYKSCGWNLHRDSWKPLLLPMSSLYTEMEDGTVPMKVIGELLEYDLKKYVDNDGYIFYGFELTDTSIPHKVPMEDREIYFIYFDTQSRWFYMVNQFLEVDSDCDHIPFSLEVADYLDSLHCDWRYGLIDKGLALDKTKIK